MVGSQDTMNLREVHLTRSKLAERKEDLEAFLTKINNQESLLGYYQYLVGNVYLELGHYKKALYQYSLAITQRSEVAIWYFARGFVYYRLGDHYRAIEDFNQAIEINPDYAEA